MNKMEEESGVKEQKKAFEDVTTRNVRAGVQFGNDTRKLVRELEEKIISLEGAIRNYDFRLENFQNQLAALQQKLYGGGSS